MGKYLKLCVLLVFCVSMVGCGLKREPSPEELEAARLAAEAQAREKQRAEAEEKLLEQAHAAIGTPYVFGGTRPGGFDCSGLVLWAYKSVGVSLPRTAREQSRVGEHITEVSEMRPGDIVAFRHPRRGYHTGIYVGDGKFIHSPQRRKTVRINRLTDSYFSTTFLGARRVSLEGGDELLTQIRLADYAEEKALRELDHSQEGTASARTGQSAPKKQTVAVKQKKQQPKAEARKAEKRRAEARKADKRRAEARKAEKRRAEVRKGEKRRPQQARTQQRKKNANMAQGKPAQKQRKQQRRS